MKTLIYIVCGLVFLALIDWKRARDKKARKK